jgi:iron transport multicopper oxidase
MQNTIVIPKGIYDQCDNLGVKTSGNAAGFTDEQTFTGIQSPPGLYPTYMQTKGVVSLAACVVSALIGLYTVLWYASFDNPTIKVELQ